MSDKPVTERLQIKNGRTLAVLNAPQDMEVEVALAAAVRADLGHADVVLLFVAGRTQLDADLTTQLAQLKPGAILWVAYPKLTSGLAGDLSRDVIRTAVPLYGLNTVSQIAINHDWSALRLKRL